jgi:hypothetical protein
VSTPLPPQLPVTRRTTLKWIAIVAAALGPAASLSAAARAYATGAPARGYGRDPDLLAPPHSSWPLTLTSEERAFWVVLLDHLLPAHEHGPAASALGLVEFLDEWLSAPYPDQQADARQLRPLAAAFDALALQRAGSRFATAEPAARASLVATFATGAGPTTAAFRRLCVLAAAAYYTTPAGLEAIGFVGNVPRATFDGPPPEVLARLDAAAAALPSRASTGSG